MIMMIIVAVVALAALALLIGVGLGGSVFLFSIGGIGIFIKFVFSVLIFFLGVGLKILLPIFLIALIIYLIINRK